MRPIMIALAFISLPLLIVWALPVESANTMVLQDAFLPGWSPDGTELICCRPTHGSYGDSSIRLWRVSASGQDPVQLVVEPEGAFFPLWLPDGRRIVYLRAGPELVIFDLDGGPSTVWPVSDLWDDPGLCLTPDGDEVLYSVQHLSVGETRALNLSDGTTRFVWPGTGASISPNEQWIAFFTDDDSLAIAPLSGGAAYTVELGTLARWTPDSQFIVFSGLGSSGDLNLVMVSRDGTHRWALTDDAMADWNSSISFDGKKVAYSRCLSGDTPPYDLWVLDLDPTLQNERKSWGDVKGLFR